MDATTADIVTGETLIKNFHHGQEKLVSREDSQIGKRNAIAYACQEKNLDELVRLADSSGGLLDDALRRVAWPVLLGFEQDGPMKNASQSLWQSLPRHRDEDQVQLDVNRAFVYYPNHESEKTTNNRKSALSNLIVQVLRMHPMLYYFQGYHDIVQVLLLVLGEQEAPLAVARISLLRIRDFMLPSMSPALKHLQLLPAILQTADPTLAHCLAQTRPLFALSATLTLYAHDIQEYSDIARLYDFILAHEPVMSIYLFAAIVISRRSELLEVPEDEPEMLHFILSKLPQPLDLEALISGALDLFEKHPPWKLPGLVWWKLSSLSVLKTSKSLSKKQSLEDGEDLFNRQVRQMKMEERQRKVLVFVSQNRSPIFSITAALLVGAVSVWLRRNGHDRALWSQLWRIWDTSKVGR